MENNILASDLWEETINDSKLIRMIEVSETGEAQNRKLEIKINLLLLFLVSVYK